MNGYLLLKFLLSKHTVKKHSSDVHKCLDCVEIHRDINIVMLYLELGFRGPEWDDTTLLT